MGNTVAEIGRSETLGSCCALLSLICELRNESYELTVISEICQVMMEPGPQPKKLQEKRKKKKPSCDWTLLCNSRGSGVGFFLNLFSSLSS